MKLNYLKKSVYFLLTLIILSQCELPKDKSFLTLKNSSHYDLSIKIYSFSSDSISNMANIIFNQKLIDGDTISFDSIETSLRTKKGYINGMIFLKKNVQLGALFIESGLNSILTSYENDISHHTIRKESLFTDYKITLGETNLLNYSKKLYDYYDENDSVLRDFIISGSYILFLPAGSTFSVFNPGVLIDYRPYDVLCDIRDTRELGRIGFDVFYKEHLLYNINDETAEKISTNSFYDTTVTNLSGEKINLRIGGYLFNIINDSSISNSLISK
jgi:hypothetical protein